MRGQRIAADRRRIESSPRPATSLDLRARGPLAESVADLLDEAPGVHVRRTGDGFSPQSLTLRGAPGSHLTVALDGVVLNDAASDGVDLALLPPALLERADVYRGSAPVRLGTASLAGAVELITRRPDPGLTTSLSMGAGSFGARRLAALASLRAGRIEALVALGARGTDGTFTYYDDGGAARLPGTFTLRRNAWADAIDLLARVCRRDDRGRAGPCLLTLAGWRSRGVPGPGSLPTDGPYASQRRALTRLSWPLYGDAWRGELWSAVIVRDDLFDNTGRVTLFNSAPYVARSTTASMELGATLSRPLGPLRLEPTARLRHERFGGGQTLDGDLSATRTALLAGYELSAGTPRWQLTHGAALEALADRAATTSDLRLPWTLSLGARWSPVDALTIRAHAAWARRAPTLPELYGDRGTVRGNPSLRPETGWNLDLGAVYTRETGPIRARFEVSGYVRRVDDVIALVQVNRTRFEARNLVASRVLGVEAQARLAWRDRASVTVSAALLDARILDASGTLGARVPGVPWSDLSALASVSFEPARAGRITVGAGLSYVGLAYLDESNTAAYASPARTLVNASLAWNPSFLRALTLSLDATNLLDLRTAPRPLPDGTSVTAAVQDFLGYPLPGRALFASLTLTNRP